MTVNVQIRCRLSPLISDRLLKDWTWSPCGKLVADVPDTRWQTCAPRLAPAHLSMLLLTTDSSLHSSCLRCIAFPLGKTRGCLGQLLPGRRRVGPCYVWSPLWLLCESKLQNKPCDLYDLKGVKFIIPLPCGSILPDPLTSQRNTEIEPASDGIWIQSWYHQISFSTFSIYPLLIYSKMSLFTAQRTGCQ